MADHVVMLSLIAFMATIGAAGALATRYGVDTRRDDGRKF
jgi:hypothetical protein